jgi:tetratricopeptide (TPR) repeat protein
MMMKWYLKLWPFWVFLLFFLVLLILHSPAFNAPLYYDSASRLGQNQIHFDQGLAHTINIFLQRPVPMATFYFNYLLAGGMTPSHFRICNAALLAGMAITVVMLIVSLIRASRPDTDVDASVVRVTACCLGLLFLMHPIQTYVVVYIWQRMALLAGLFSLTSVWTYVATRSGKISNTSLGYGISGLLLLLALSSKENSAVVPIVLVLVEIALFRNSLKSFVIRSAAIAGVSLLFVGTLSFLQSPHGLQESSGVFETLSRYYRESGLTIREVGLTQCRVIFSYLEMVLVPTSSNIRLFSPQILSRSLTEPASTLPAVIGVGLLLVTGLYLLRRRPLAGFGLLFFLVTLLPESILVPQYSFLGYRIILPMVGILIVAADLLVPFMARAGVSARRVPIAVCFSLIFAFLVMCLAFVDMRKAELWLDPVVFWGNVVAKLPPDDANLERASTVQALNSLGLYLQRNGRRSEAIDLHRRALLKAPRSFDALASLGNAYAAMGKVDRAQSYFYKALEVRPESADAHLALGRLFTRKGLSGKALKQFGEAVRLQPGNPMALYEMGRALMTQGDIQSAESFLRRATEINPRLHEAQYSLGKVLMKTGRHQAALDLLKKTLKNRPDYWQAHNDVGVIWGTLGRPERAVYHFREALKIKPSDIPTRRNLETALKQIEDQRHGNR